LNDKKHGFGAYLYPMNSYLIGKWNEDTMEGLNILINQNKEERLFIFEKKKCNIPITDLNLIKKIKNDIQYINLKMFLDELKGKGLFN
jgi:hypothetical protein